MNRFGRRSLRELETVHPILREILVDVLPIMDFTVLKGHRGEEEQNEAYDTGHSQLRFPHSKHNASPSLAVDIAPYPIDWNDTERFVLLAGVVKAIAYNLEVVDIIRWGGDWDQDDRMTDERFRDYPHFELVLGEEHGSDDDGGVPGDANSGRVAT